MKKIVSLILSIMLVCGLMSTVVLANEAVVSFGDAIVDGNSVIIPVVISAMPEELGSINSVEIYFSYEGLSFDQANSVFGDSFQFGTKQIADGLIGAYGSTFTSIGDGVIAKLAFTKEDATKSATLTFDEIYITNPSYDEFTSNLAPSRTYTFDAAPSVATVVPTAATLTDVVDAEYWQKGQAVSMTFAAKDIKAFSDMSWMLNCTSGVKYAPVDYPAATIAALGDAAPVQFVAAFLVNSADDKENADKISSVVAGFCDAEKNLVAQTAATAISEVPAE